MGPSTAAMVSLVHNPSLGAFCVWQFTVGYCGNGQHLAAPFDYLYDVYPVIANGKLRKEILHTTKSLWRVREKLRNSGDVSTLLRVPEMVAKMRPVSSNSILLAFSAELISFDRSLGGVIVERKGMSANLRGRLSTVERDYLRASNRLGRFAAGMTRNDYQIALGVR